MKSEWKKVRLGNICEITSSKRIFAKEYRIMGIPFYRGKEIIEKQKGAKISTALYIEPERYNQIVQKYGAPQKGDILLTSVGTLGVPYLIRQGEKFYFKDGNLTWFRNFENVESKFVYYWLLGPEAHKQVDSKCIGSTQKALTIETLLAFDILLPSLPVQRIIAATLSCLDDKIELNNKINANLEAQAQAIFKSWFVDFEPFQDGEFEDSELGPIPKGWKIGSLGNIARYAKERISIQCCTTENYISTENMQIDKKGVVPAGALPATNTVCGYAENDILISNIRPYFKKIWFSNKTGGCSNDVLVIRARDKSLTGFLYSILYSDSFFNYATATSKGTKMPRGDKLAIMNYPVVFPVSFKDDLYIQKMSLLVLQFQKRIGELKKENDILIALRDTLLPKLMSGEITVPAEGN